MKACVSPYSAVPNSNDAGVSGFCLRVKPATQICPLILISTKNIQCVASLHTEWARYSNLCLTLLVSVAYKATQVNERLSVVILDKFGSYCIWPLFDLACYGKLSYCLHFC